MDDDFSQSGADTDLDKDFAPGEEDLEEMGDLGGEDEEVFGGEDEE